MRLTATSLSAIAALALAACGEKAEPEPVMPSARVVEEAARASWSADTLHIKLEVAGSEDGWTGTGLVRPGRGQYRIEARADGVEPGDTNLSSRPIVVGTQGFGLDAAAYETDNRPISRDGDRCWFIPWGPVGLPGAPLSVEETTRLTGAILEHLRTPPTSVRALGSTDNFAVRFPAAHRRGKRDNKPNGVWQADKLMDLISGPIRVVVDDNRIAAINYELRGYKHERLPGGQRGPGRIRIGTQLPLGIDSRLRLSRPSCLAIT